MGRRTCKTVAAVAVRQLSQKPALHPTALPSPRYQDSLHPDQPAIPHTASPVDKDRYNCVPWSHTGLQHCQSNPDQNEAVTASQHRTEPNPNQESSSPAKA